MNESVLVVAAHPDDEVLGCGGTIARLTAQGRPVHVLILADGEGSRANSLPGALASRQSAARQANAILGSTSLELLGLPDNRLDSLDLLDLVKLVEIRIERYRPTMVLTHHAGDLNIDHRIAHEATITACRPQPQHSVRELLFFEIPSSTEWRPTSSGPAFAPNWFEDISEALDIKLSALLAYPNELRDFPHSRSLRAIESLARWRGAGVGVNAAEGFIVGRCIR